MRILRLLLCLLRLVFRLPRNLARVPILIYRRLLSSKMGAPSWRFTPTCSAYGDRAISDFGVLVGVALTAWRILRCNPFCRGGEDPVPTVPPFMRWQADRRTREEHKNKGE